MTDLWLRSTKDIEKNVETARPGGGDGGLVNEVYPDDGGTRSTSQVEGNNANNSQKVILGNQAQTNNNSGGDGLVNENPQNNPNAPQPRKNIGAIPPPAADGSVTEAPESEEEISGDIELF